MPGEKVEKRAFLKILQLPRAAVYPSKLYFVSGITFNLTCHARGILFVNSKTWQVLLKNLLGLSISGVPKPEITWYTKGHPITPTKNKYYITYRSNSLSCIKIFFDLL